MTKADDAKTHPGAGALVAEKRPYTAPALVEYGSIAKLTQGGTGGTKTDSMSMTAVMASCL